MLDSIVNYRNERVVSHSILKQRNISMVVFAMDKGEEISEEIELEVGWIYVLDGSLHVTVGDKSLNINKGNAVLIPANELHALKALQRCKYLQINIEEQTIMEKGEFIKKVPVREVMCLANLIEYEEHKISSISIVQKKDLIITLFALDQGEEMGGHASTGDAMVNILEGIAEITIGGKAFTVEAGQSIIMPANVEHSLKAVKSYKMLLTVVKG